MQVFSSNVPPGGQTGKEEVKRSRVPDNTIRMEKAKEPTESARKKRALGVNTGSSHCCAEMPGSVTLGQTSASPCGSICVVKEEELTPLRVMRAQRKQLPAEWWLQSLA